MKLSRTFFIIFTIILFQKINYTQIKTLDRFENTDGWNFIKSDGVDLSLSVEKGFEGNAIKFDYDFTKGTGYGGMQKFFSIDLPENFEFTFYIKANSPSNNFEIKFIDSSGQNVWWVNNRNFSFPKEWTKFKIKKRHISFAWGPTEDQTLKKIDRIEFTVASFVGGKGTIWIDDLKFEPLDPETESYPQPIITTKSFSFSDPPSQIIDGLEETYWKSIGVDDQSITIDFKTRREFGGLKIDWLKEYQAESFEILASFDGKEWDKIYKVSSNKSNVSFIRLPEAEARFLKINFLKSTSDNGFAICEISFLKISDSQTPNDFILYAAEKSSLGNYPRYFSKQASYWTITGVDEDVKETLFNEDGMIELDKGSFSIEPIISLNGKLFNWSNVNLTQTLEDNYLPIPIVNWDIKNLELETQIFANGEANHNSMLYIKYKLKNNSDIDIQGKLFLLIRPFQVNPYYQFLNMTGGVGKIYSIKESDNKIFVNDDKVILPITNYDHFGASQFDEGDIINLIREEKLPENNSVIDQNNLASGVLVYDFIFKPEQEKIIYLAVPFYGENSLKENLSDGLIEQKLEQTKKFWIKKLNHITFNLPHSAEKIINTYKSNLAYILINKDKSGIQPGSRSYERSWIRDGSITSSALLKSGIVSEVQEFIDWYSSFQYENGKVPCVVDFRGPDPVNEYDSNGELIYLIHEYFRFTQDTTFLRLKNINVLKTVNFIKSLIAQRSTDHYKLGNDSVRAYYGILPESISHEGYSAKPMHSYWDNFFTIKGLKDATEIQKILNEKKNYNEIKKIRDAFKKNLYNSLNLAMKVREIDYIPGCVELGDFDATSTTIALTPCNELNNLPKPQIYNTFNKYFDFFEKRKNGETDWVNYTPYENRIISSFIMLDQPERAHELINYFLADQRPQGWNHWAEVVWKDYRNPRFIGDMPHTWVGSDFINAIRSMFVYENDYDQSLVLASALYQDWIDSPTGMSIENLPTYFGDISYSVKKIDNKYVFTIYGNIKLPENGIKIKNFNQSKKPLKIFINGKESNSFSNNEIDVKEFPAKVIIEY